jgi:hypothetical protein
MYPGKRIIVPSSNTASAKIQQVYYICITTINLLMKSTFVGHWIIAILIIFSNTYTYAQNKMQPFDKLINNED